MNITYNQFSDLIFNSKAFKDIYVIGISGSIGRREKKINDKNLNDIDFFVISKDVDLGKKEILDKNLKELTSTQFTDVNYINKKIILENLNENTVSQYLFDTIKGSIVIFQKELFFNKLIAGSFKVNIESAKLVLLTRLWCLVGPYKIKSNIIKPIDETFTVYQIKKALSAIVDAVLIKEETYQSPNSKVKQIFFLESKFYNENKDLYDAILNLLEANEFSNQLHAQVVRLYLIAFKEIVKKNINLLNFPIKYFTIKALYNKPIREYVGNKIYEFKTLRKIHIFYNSPELIDNNNLKKMITNNYRRVLK
jgi:hypothetical protein